MVCTKEDQPRRGWLYMDQGVLDREIDVCGVYGMGDA